MPACRKRSQPLLPAVVWGGQTREQPRVFSLSGSISLSVGPWSPVLPAVFFRSGQAVLHEQVNHRG